MMEPLPGQGRSEIDTLVLRTLVRKLVEKGVLSADDVKSLLFAAAKAMDEVGGAPTDQVARTMVDEDLAPDFLGGNGQ